MKQKQNNLLDRNWNFTGFWRSLVSKKLGALNSFLVMEVSSSDFDLRKREFFLFHRFFLNFGL